MAQYEYECECGNSKTLDQGMTEKHTAKCEVCNRMMRRVFLGIPFYFQGRPRWFDVKKSILDADYQRKSFLKMKEEKGERV